MILAIAAGAARWGRGALGVLLTYALFIQLVFAGMVAERMAFAASAVDPICAADGHGGGADGTDTGTAAHGQACVVCAFAGLAPPLPARVSSTLPAVAPCAIHQPVPSHTAAEARPDPSPRSSQGPPALG